MDIIKSFEKICALSKTNYIIKGLDDNTLTENDQNDLVKDIWADIM